MKVILICVYLAHGSMLPRMEFSQVEALSECRDLAALYVKRATKGQAWAICAKTKGQ